MKGLSGLSSDMREIENAAAAGHQRARQALDIFCYRVKKYISAYIGVLNGADLIVFTGGIGENSALVREKSLSNLENLGILVDPERNKIAHGVEGIISSAESKINVLAIPTNEELVIALETEKVIITSQ